MLIIILLLASITFIVVSTTKYKLHPFLALLFTALGFGIFAGLPFPVILQSINEGFGGTTGRIGIIIILGTIIGTFLEESGGAFAIADKVLKITGYRQVPLAMNLIGWFVSIPVFADSGFVILSPLNKALAKKTKLSLAVTAIALALGLMTTHSLVPPTPGPLAAASILNVDLGLLLMFGIPVSLLASLAGWVFALNVGKKYYIDPNPELSEEAVAKQMQTAPSAFKSFMPILLPILLIILKSVADLPAKPFATGKFYEVIGFIGEPIIALLAGVFLSFLLPRKFDKEMLSASGWMGKALLNSALIIMVTAAGGAFGKILQSSGMSEIIGNYLVGYPLGIWLPFIIAAALKTAQGSSTVAIITVSSIMAPLLPAMGLTSDVARVLVVLAIGAGAMVVSHANDSFFWVVTQMSGMEVKIGYRLLTLGCCVIGISAALTLYIISFFIP